jgi:hypothetical protein
MRERSRTRRERRVSRRDDWRSDERNAVFGLPWPGVQPRFVKSDDNVGFQRDARAPHKAGAYAGLL